MNAPKKLRDLCELIVQTRDFRQGISTDNCLFLLTLADAAGFKVLFQESLEFCLRHFTQLTDSDEFVRLDKRLLIQLLQSDFLNVTDELFVLAAISKWSVTNQVDQQVVSTVRFSLIKKEELEKFNNKHLVELAKNINGGQVEQKYPRTPDKRERLVALFGLCLYRYDPVTHAWARVAPVPVEMHGIDYTKFTLAILGDSLYILCSKKIWRFHLKHHTWHEDVALMKCPRDDVSAVVLNGSLYVLGGTRWLDPEESFAHYYNACTVERYDACNNIWHLCAPMRHSRGNSSATVLDGCIYVTGGCWAPKSEGYIECYRPHEDTWSSMSDPESLGWRCMALSSLVSFEGCLYLLDELGNIFKYHSKSDVWEKFNEGYLASTSRLHFLNGKLYASYHQYFQVLDQVIGDAEFRWRWRRLKTPTSPREIKFTPYELHQWAIFHGLDCADPSKTD